MTTINPTPEHRRELRATHAHTQAAIDRAWRFAKSPNCTCEEHDDIIAAVRLANRVPALLDHIERLEAENAELRERARNSIQFAGGQSPLVCGSGSVSSRTVYSVGEAIKDKQP